MDAVCGALDRHDMRESHEAAFCCCIICLPGVTEHCRCRACEEEASVPVGLHRLIGRLAHVEGSLEMNVDERIDLAVGQILKPVISQKPGVVDDDVDATEGIECRFHDGFAACSCGDSVVAGHGLAAGIAYGLNHSIGRAM